MELERCISKIMKGIKERKNSEDGKWKTFDELDDKKDYDIKHNWAWDIKDSIAGKIELIFGEMSDSKKDGVFVKCTDVEVDFLRYLYLNFQRRRENIFKPNDNIDIHIRLLRDEWCYISQEEREEIVRYIDKLSSTPDVILKYLNVAIGTDMESAIEDEIYRIKKKLLHNEYYVLMNNILQLCNLVLIDYGELESKVDVKALDSFSNNLDKLLRKHQKSYSSLIRGYARNQNETDEELNLTGYTDIDDNEYNQMIDDALSNH